MTQPPARTVAVIGGGPAGLMAAEILAAAGHRVDLHERMPSLGRKFLLAGRGGLNLTHGEPLPRLLDRYGGARADLEAVIAAFPPTALVAWCEGLGQATFTGSSGRIFPRAMKASPLLRAWLGRLDGLGVRVHLRHRWTGWAEDGALLFEQADGATVKLRPDATILALGGASWPRLGSDGGWAAPLADAGIAVTPLQPSNCGFRVAWSERFGRRFAGTPLQRIALTISGTTMRGEAMITAAGIEGGAVYALSPELRAAIARDGHAIPTIDLRPDLEHAGLAAALARPRARQSLSTFLRKAAKLSPAAIALLHEAADGPAAPLSADPDALARRIKALPLRFDAPMPIERAISTAGGIAFAAVDANLMLRARPGVFVAGEMLDWEAPTGGYLLQACFATGRAAGLGAIAWLAAEADPAVAK